MYPRLLDAHLSFRRQSPGFAHEIRMPGQHTIRIDQCCGLKKLLKIGDSDALQIQAAMEGSRRRVALEKRSPFSLQANPLRPLPGKVDRNVDSEWRV